MKETCEDCPEVADCLGICEKIKSQLEELPKWPPERSESLFNKKQRDIEKVSGDTPGIDRFRKINPAKVYEDVTDTEIDWEHTLNNPKTRRGRVMLKGYYQCGLFLRISRDQKLMKKAV